MATESLTEALGILQDASDKLVAALRAIEEHNINTEAHQDIRELVTGILEKDVIYTNQQIIDLVNETIRTHTEQSFDLAHPGFEEYKVGVEELIASCMVRVESLERWRDTGIVDESKTDLQKQLQIVENKYSIILDSLQNALVEAQANDSTTLVEEIKESIAATLEQKNAELMAIITNWQAEHNRPKED